MTSFLTKMNLYKEDLAYYFLLLFLGWFNIILTAGSWSNFTSFVQEHSDLLPMVVPFSVALCSVLFLAPLFLIKSPALRNEIQSIGVLALALFGALQSAFYAFDIVFVESSGFWVTLTAYCAFFDVFSLDFFFYTDTLSILFLLLTNFLVIICLLLVMPAVLVDPKGYLSVFILASLWVQLLVTFSAGNLFLFFIAFESLVIPLLFLIGIWGSPNRVQANNYLYFYTTVGAVGILLSILYLWKTFDTTEIRLLSIVCSTLSWDEKCWLWLGFFISFAIKTPLVPFHIWLPKAHVEAPTTGSVLLAGLLLKIGLYGLIRICMGLFPDVCYWAQPVVSTLAIVGIVYASLITLRQIDMKRIIAYSSVSHMSLALASVITGHPLGVASGVYLSLSHGIVSRALFILVGGLYARFHNRLVSYYGGLMTWMPVYGIFFFFFSLANMAFPLTSGFMGEFLCLTSILSQNTLLGVLAASSMLFSTVYSILLFNRVFLGSLKVNLALTNTTDLRSLDITSLEFLILTPCVVLTCYFGIFPSALMLPWPL